MKNRINYFGAWSGGFTLMETLVAVMILTILITMAVPIYERSVEKSRLAEVSTVLKRLSESKLRTMDSMNLTTFNGQFGLDLLDVSVPDSDDFTYSLSPTDYPNAVCAVRSRGDNEGTMFLYVGETAAESCNCAGHQQVGGNVICGAYCQTGRQLFCKNSARNSSSCEAYGLTSYNVGECSI